MAEFGYLGALPQGGNYAIKNREKPESYCGVIVELSRKYLPPERSAVPELQCGEVRIGAEAYRRDQIQGKGKARKNIRNYFGGEIVHHRDRLPRGQIVSLEAGQRKRYTWSPVNMSPDICYVYRALVSNPHIEPDLVADPPRLAGPGEVLKVGEVDFKVVFHFIGHIGCVHGNSREDGKKNWYIR